MFSEVSFKADTALSVAFDILETKSAAVSFFIFPLRFGWTEMRVFAVIQIERRVTSRS